MAYLTIKLIYNITLYYSIAISDLKIVKIIQRHTDITVITVFIESEVLFGNFTVHTKWQNNNR